MTLRASALAAAVAAGVAMFGISAALAVPASGVAIDQAAAAGQNVQLAQYHHHHHGQWHWRHVHRHHHWYWHRYWW